MEIPPEKEVADVNEKRELWRLPGLFFVCRKPLARRVVPKKACADDEDRKTPFVVK